MNSTLLAKKLILSSLIILIHLTFTREIKRIYKADTDYTESQNQFRTGDFQEALEFANWALEKNDLEPRYHYGRAKIYLATTINQTENIQNELKKLALKDLETALSLNPKNLVTMRNIIPMYYFLGAKDLSKPSTKAGIDLNFVGVTQNYYKQIKRCFPNDAGIHVLLAKYEKRLGLTEDYKDSVENIKRLRPDLLDWHPSLN